MKRLILPSICLVVLSGCASIDKERATEQRKADLCSEIATRDLSHCAGNHILPPPYNPETDPEPSEN